MTKRPKKSKHPERELGPSRKNDRKLLIRLKGNLRVQDGNDFELVCRGEYFEKLSTFIKEHVTAKMGNAIGVYGAPGMGKTSVVQRVAASFRSASTSIHYVHCGSDNVKLELERLIRSAQQIVIVDEMDFALDESSRLRNWLLKFIKNIVMGNSRLIFVGISNLSTTINKLHEIVGEMKTIVFQPYTKQQLLCLLESRLEGHSAVYFKEGALEYLCAQIANDSGDARKCLDLCRTAMCQYSEPKLGIITMRQLLLENINHSVNNINGLNYIEMRTLIIFARYCKQLNLQLIPFRKVMKFQEYIVKKLIGNVDRLLYQERQRMKEAFQRLIQKNMCCFAGVDHLKINPNFEAIEEMTRNEKNLMLDKLMKMEMLIPTKFRN